MTKTAGARFVRRGLMTMIVTGLILLGPASAWAGTVTISVGAPASATVGSRVEVQATVLSDGVPVAGAIVALSYHTSFAGMTGPVELTRAVTDANGFAALFYEQRAADNGEMSVDYVGPDEGVEASSVFGIAVEPGGDQLYRSSSGVSIRWLNATVVIGLIALLWSVIVFSAFQLVLVGRRGGTPDPSRPGARLVGDEGSAWIGTALATAALITAVGMVIVFERSPSTHGNLTDPVGFTRSPLTYLGSEYPYMGYGLRHPEIAATGDPIRDGATVWVQDGCVACHGTHAAGGPVGPNMSDLESLSDLTRQVRKGPGLMPAFAIGTVSDEDLAKIYAWLAAGSPVIDRPMQAVASCQLPVASCQVPVASCPLPVARHPVRTNHLSLGCTLTLGRSLIRRPVSGIWVWYLVSGIWHLASGIRHLVSLPPWTSSPG